MEKLSTITYGVITLFVVVLLIFTLAIPVIEDLQKQQTTEMQNTGERYSISATSESYEFIVSAGDAKVNGVSASTIIGDTTTPVIFAISDVVTVWYYSSTSWMVCSTDALGTSHIQFVQGSVSCVFENGTVTITDPTADTGYEVTQSYSWLLTFDSAGDYGAWSTNTITSPLYVDSKSTIYMTTGSNGAKGMIIAKGTIDSLKVLTSIVSDSAVDDTSITLTYTPTDYDASNKVTAVQITNGEGNNQLLYAPIKYTVITENQNMIWVLLGVIPLILSIIPIMIATQLIAGNRRD